MGGVKMDHGVESGNEFDIILSHRKHKDITLTSVTPRLIPRRC